MKALVLGAGGFVGSNLVYRLKEQGWYVEGVDLKFPVEPSIADNFRLADLRYETIDTNYDRIYQLAAEMGGAGFIFTGDNDADIMTNSLGININVLKQLKDFSGKVFYSSSVCVYPDSMENPQAYPANPPSNYGWEKLTSERLYESYAKNYGLNISIARFHNTYGPYCTFEGGREKSPAAICRKVFQATDEIEIWGDGKQIRPFIYIDDLLDGIEDLINSPYSVPVVLGPKQGISINDMVDIVCKIAGKKLKKVYVDGPTGEQIRHSNTDYVPETSLELGLEITYNWISEQYGRI